MHTASVARSMSSAITVLTTVLVALAAPAAVQAQAEVCPATSPTTDPNAATALQTLTAKINASWANAATHAQTTLDPLKFETGDITSPCPSDGGTTCFFGAGLTKCLHTTSRWDISNLTGLSQLTFSDLTPTEYEAKDVALHSEPGPEAGKVTDGVFAPAGTSWNHPSYAVVLPLAGAASALVVDLGTA